MIANASVIAGALAMAMLCRAEARPSGNQPSWFPKQSCSEAWNKTDLARYDERRDARIEPGVGNTGYQTYLDRLARKGIQRSECYKPWTVLVYMAADNDLSPYALWDLHEMEGAFGGGAFGGSTLRSDLLVQADTAGLTGVRRFHIFQQPGKRYVVPKGVQDFANSSPAEVHSPLVQYVKETKRASAADHQAKLREFLDWGMRAYPSEHYLVIVWGHGQGWAGDSSVFNGRFGGLVFSDSERDYLSIPSLSRILDKVSHSTLEGKKKIDVYASDACLMQMVEVANEISPSVRFIVGSAQVQSYLGLPYRQLMYQINTGRFYDGAPLVNSDDEAYMVARMLPLLAEKSFDPVHGQQGRADKAAVRTFTMSALSTAGLQQQLIPALTMMSSRLNEYIAEDDMRTVDLEFLMSQVPGFMGGARELGSFIGLLQNRLEEEATERKAWTKSAQRLWEAAEEVKAAVQATSIQYSYGTGYREQAEPLHLLGYRALGIWLPQSQQEFKARIADFRQSSLFKTGASSSGRSPWENWLTAVFDPMTLSQRP